MPMEPGTYTFGPGNATLTVRTKRTGAAARAGHDLLLEVTSWSATLELGAEPEATRVTLTADPTSLRVVEGTGGMQALDDDDRSGIEQTIRDEVLVDTAIEFRSTAVEPGAGSMTVTGDLELAGSLHPVSFALEAGEDGRVTGSAVVRQSNWGMKPYSALFGTLKVADELEVAVETEPHRD